MKYGLLKFKKIPIGREVQKSNDLAKFNIGDNIQMLALKRIYIEELQIPEEDIIEIDFHELATYVGEYVILPINLFFFGCHDAKEKWFPASPYIIPVFIGVHFSTQTLTPEEIDYLRYYAPIGCRDEFTLNTMRAHDIPSYLFGCITATLPKRKDKARNVTYLVDVDVNEVLKRLPQKLRENVKIVNHERTGIFSPENLEESDRIAANLIDEYRNQASLVITSRMHCASPCMAMGIPTIMIVKEKSQRFSWLGKLIKIYSTDEYDNIDWNVTNADYEDIKSLMINSVKSRLLEAKEKYKTLCEISEFYESGLTNDFVGPFYAFYHSLRQLLTGDVKGYYLWGATALAEEAFNYIQKNRPDIVFKGLIDEYNRVIFQNKASIKFEDIDTIGRNDLFIITPTSAKNYAREKLRYVAPPQLHYLPTEAYSNKSDHYAKLLEGVA